MLQRPGERLGEILDELGRLGAVLPGSISERRTRCQRSGCHCRSDDASLHGPYPTWTWRPDGVPMTKTLTPSEAERLAPYSEAHRRLRRLVSELEQVSLELIEQHEGVKLRRSRSVGPTRPEAGE